ncbi:MBL fold metallo-hydrolase [Reyranella sp. CPCC 100927]|uniref:MBL fold metallo-hydrolase n=1 Tax=Reyranella sp. CPCC 100927 TaxID=2599616 RepID=UPI0011B5A717|nr:MBL fold metallo-hydrolase [Reyranella sp. CPCC 100927]TWT01677.1 MBL fold metallo-hydrolase [Reyranella sp. CPCC 100927]
MKLIASGPNHASFAFGDVKVVALRDGYVDMPPTRLRQVSGLAFKTVPAGVALVGGQLRLSVNAFLIIEAERSVLIDTGASNSWLPTMGALLAAMQEAGIDRHSVTHVALTHTHEDHVNGLIAPDGSAAFPRMEHVFVGQEELSVFRGRLASLRDRTRPIDDRFQVSTRITAVKAAGHSAGHTAYEIDSGAGRLLAWGDTMHVPSIQFARPEVAWEFDSNQSKAREARLMLMERAVQPNYLVAGAHLDFPGIGRVTRNGEAFVFQAI